MLVVTAVLGRDFSAAALQKTAAIPEDALLDALDEALLARVIADSAKGLNTSDSPTCSFATACTTL